MLKEKKAEELEGQLFSTPLHPHFLEVSTILLGWVELTFCYLKTIILHSNSIFFYFLMYLAILLIRSTNMPMFLFDEFWVLDPHKLLHNHTKCLATNTQVFPLLRISNEVKDADDVRTLIKDIWDIRDAKLRMSVNKMVNHDSGGGKPLSHVKVRRFVLVNNMNRSAFYWVLNLASVI